jgi:hypothetical protein
MSTTEFKSLKKEKQKRNKRKTPIWKDCKDDSKEISLFLAGESLFLKGLCNFSFGVLHLNSPTWYIHVLRLMEIVFTFEGSKLCNL